MNVTPILYNNDRRDRDGNKDSQRSCNSYRNAKRQQGDGEQRFAETERRSNQRCEKNDEKDQQADDMDGNLSGLLVLPGNWPRHLGLADGNDGGG